MVCSGVVVVSRIVHEVIMAMTKELHANIRCAQCSHLVADGQFTNTRFACIFAQPNEVANGDGQTNPKACGGFTWIMVFVYTRRAI